MKTNLFNAEILLGNKKANNANNTQTIYKSETFNAYMRECNETLLDEKGEIPPTKLEKAIKKTRKKIRLLLLDILETFKKQKDKEKQKIFANEFAKFYSSFYLINDYTLNSVTNGKMKPESITLINETLPLLKALNAESNETKETKKKK